MEYQKLDGMNWSSLKHMATSPRMYRWRTKHAQKVTDAMEFGLAVHCALLEPNKFDERYDIFDGRRQGKVWDAWQEEHPGVQALKPPQIQALTEICTSVKNHKDAAPLFENAMTEQVIQWVDPDTGMKCKGRIDLLHARRLDDLKSCGWSEPRLFRQQASRLLYHGQMAWYHYGAIAAGVLPPDAEPPRICAPQTSEPYDVVVYRLTDVDLMAGRAVCLELMEKLYACAVTDLWPGVAPDILPLDLPGWALGYHDEDEVI